MASLVDMTPVTDVLNVDALVVQVVRGLTFHWGRLVLQVIPDESKVWSPTPLFLAHFFLSRIGIKKYFYFFNPQPSFVITVLDSVL